MQDLMIAGSFVLMLILPCFVAMLSVPRQQEAIIPARRMRKRPCERLPLRDGFRPARPLPRSMPRQPSVRRSPALLARRMEGANALLWFRGPLLAVSAEPGDRYYLELPCSFYEVRGSLPLGQS